MQLGIAMNEQELNNRVKLRAGFRSAREGNRAIAAAIGALRCALTDEDAQLMARGVPARFRKVLGRPGSDPVPNATALYEETERRERVGLGFAMEHAQVVLQVLAELLDVETVVRLRKRLPADIADLFRPHESPAEVPPYVHEHPRHRAAARQTLSRARPGSAEPIADARHPLAHESSVARSQQPHAERSIGTARTARPAREDETLATARPAQDRK